MPLVFESNYFPEDKSHSAWKSVRIVEAKGDGFLVTDQEASFEAVLAPSCLVEPLKGDLVLAYFDQDLVYITSVLKRGELQATLRLPDRTSIKSSQLDLKVKSFFVAAQETKIQADQTTLGGKLLKLDFKIVHFLANLVSSVCRSFLGSSKNLTLKVDGVTRVTSQSLRLSAKEDLLIRAEGVDLKAQDSVKIDGRDVRLG